MATNWANTGMAYVASYDGNRNASKTQQLATLRRIGRERQPGNILGSLARAMNALVNDLRSFFAWKPKSNSMCANYGHVFDRRTARGQANRCDDCGELIQSLDQVRGTRSAGKSNGCESRSVVRW
jgi:hypothetical protein